MTGPGYGQGPPGGPYEQQPGGYGGAGWPAAQQPPYGQGPPSYGTPPPYPQPGYGPYPGQGYPGGGYGGGPVRPATVWAAMALLIVSALPALGTGVYVLVLAAQQSPSGAMPDDPLALYFESAAAGFNRFAVGLGLLLAVYALIYVVLAVVAALGQSWARTMLAVLTTLWDLPVLVLVLVAVSYADAATPPLLLAMWAGVLVASVAGMVVIYLPANRPYFATPRR